MNYAIAIYGKNRLDTKKKALIFWVNNRERLNADFNTFLNRCRINKEGTRIIYRPFRERLCQPVDINE